MNELHEVSRGIGRDIVEYLSTLRLLSDNLDVEVRTPRYQGLIQVRGGVVLAASQGRLTGNGALFTLITQKQADISATPSVTPVTTNVAVNHEQMLHICREVSAATGKKSVCNEAVLVDDAVHLFLQFRKKEAGAKLVEVLRCNRFYYPAWLWHSRLMSRVDYLGKALNEMRKWGGHDALVKAELAKIEPQLSGKETVVKRCIFCWALVKTGQDYCSTCNCFLSISAKAPRFRADYQELESSLDRYEQEFANHPGNSRIAYCLCLGKFSLGQREQAQRFLDKAISISPGEQLFLKTAKFLKTSKVAPSVPVKEKKCELAHVAPVVSNQPKVGVAKGKTILVIEDSSTSRSVISLILKRQGYNIVEATTGCEGLARLVDIVPDLVLLDVVLPDMDGYQILTELRLSARLKDVVVVMLTGKTSSIDRMKGLACGANEYLTKPFDPAKFLKVLERFLGQGSRNRASAPRPKEDVDRGANGGIKPASVKARVKVAVGPPARQVPIKVPSRQLESTGPFILIIEDSPTTRKVISMVLGRKGYFLQESINGKEALQQLEERVPDLILLDAMLPDMSGYDILVQLKKAEKFKDIPVVMLTAKSGATDRQKGMQSGAVAYLTKPFDPDKLLSTVAQYIPASSRI